MRKPNFIFLVLTLFSIIPFNATSQVPEWAEVFGNQTYSQQPGHPIAEVAHQVVTDNMGNVYVSGNYSIPVIYRGDSAFTEEGQRPIAAVLSKMSPDGTLIWSRIAYSYNYGSRMLKPAALAFDSDSNLVVMIKAKGEYAFNGSGYAGGLYDGKESMLIYKISMDDSVHWQKVIRGPASTVANNMFSGGMAIGANGSIYLAVRHKLGSFFNNAILSSGSTNRGNYSILKLDSAGNIDWKTDFRARTDLSYVTEADNYYGVEGLTIDEIGNTYLIAYVDSGALDTSTILPSYLNASATYHHNLTLIKFDQSGDVLWHKPIKSNPIGLGDARLRLELNYFDSKLFLAGTSYAGTYLNLSVDDSIIVDSAQGSYVLMLDTAGSYLDHITTNSQHLIISEMQEVDSLIYVAGTLVNFSTSVLSSTSPLLITSSSDQLQYAAGPDRGVCFTLNKQTMEMRRRTVVNATNNILSASIRLRGLQVLPNHDFYLSGVTSASIAINNDTVPNPVSSGNNSEAFLVKVKNCDYLNPSIAGAFDTTFICQGGSAPLSGSSSESGVDYQWYYGSTVISGETDSILAAYNAGTYRVRVSDSLCYMDSDPVFVQSGSSSTVSFNLPTTTFCTDDTTLLLNQGSPSGGTYTGSGVVGSTFSPSVAGVGLHELQYIYDQGTGCVDTVSEYVTVSSADAVFFASFSAACVGDSITLTTGFPSGGFYSGPGVSGNLFSPSIADTGYIHLVYTISNGGCFDSDSIQVYVAPTPTVTLSLGTTNTCEVIGFLPLTGQSPSGGSFSGTAVTGNYFIPSVAGPGVFPITYSVTNGGCTGTAVDTIVVDSFPVVSLPALDSICEGASTFTLDHGLPAGGTYSGTGISSNDFNASNAGIGATSVMYIYQNSCASDTAFSTISVISDPTISASLGDVSCSGGTDGSISIAVSGGNGPYDFIWATGDSSSAIAGLNAGNYNVTASGEGGCSVSAAYVVSQPSVLSITLDSIDDVVCNGFSDGAAYISVSGGTSPYSYAWSNGSTNEDANSLGVGTHTVVVTDSNGCQDSLSVTISEVSPVVISSTKTDVSCYASSDGNISASISGGGGIFTSLWNTGDTTSALSALDTGTYILTVTDQNGCSSLDTSIIGQPDSLSLSVSSVAPLCYGYANGTISVGVSGGTTGYAYAWSTGAILDSIASIAAGSYSVTVTDANGCVASETVTLANPDSISLTVSESESILCFGGNNGELTTTMSGGVGTISYVWSNSSASATISNLSTGTYTVTVSDQNGCANSASYALLSPTQLVASIDSIMEPTCNNDSNGFIAVSSIGGTGAPSYLWNTGSIGDSLLAIDSGLYSVTITDSNGCQDSLSVVVSDPDSIYVTFIIAGIACNGDGDGSVTATAVNAIGGSSFQWSNGASTPMIDSLSGGYYALTITDGNGCIGMGEAFVSEPNPLGLNSVVYNENECNGDSTGQIVVSPIGGGGIPFSYLWSTGDTNSTIDSLFAGSYGLTVTSSNGCEFDTVLVLSDPLPISITIDSTNDLLCFGDTNGFAALIGTGGNGIYDWQWSDGGTSAIRSNLSAGTYTVTLIDGYSGACTTDTTLTITSPNLITLLVDSSLDVLCHADTTGFISISATGGVTPYSFSWNTGASASQLFNLSAGIYSLTLTDANGCNSTIAHAVQEPEALEIFSGINSATCSNVADGVISIQAAGGVAPYDFSWSTGASTPLINDLATGTYFLSITDSNGCLITDSFVVDYSNEAPLAYLGADTGICAGDSFLLLAGDTGAYLWSTGSTNASTTINGPGVYSVTITRASGCLASDSIEVVGFPSPLVDIGNDTLICQEHLNDGLLLASSPGLAQYNWSTGGVDSTELVTAFGSYWLIGTNAFGCSAADTIEIISDTCLGIANSNLSVRWNLYPNPNAGYFTVQGVAPSNRTLQLRIYNAYGQLVFTEPLKSDQQYIDAKHLASGFYRVIVFDGPAPTYIHSMIIQ